MGSTLNKILTLTEHKESDEYCDQDLMNKALDFSGPPEDFMGVPNMLGLSAKRGKSEKSIVLIPSFFIGATWIIPNRCAAVVLPKIEDIDFMEMFTYALQLGTPDERQYFSKCYGIDIDSPEIEVKSELNIITPLIMLHFISLLEEITKNGLKKGYVTNECNLKSKIKGRILFSPHLSSNIIPKKEDRAYCRFSEYTADIPENRLLKKALVFVQASIYKYTAYSDSDGYGKLPVSVRINRLLSYFRGISDNVSISDVQKSKANKLYSSYTESIRLAKLILRCLDNDVARESYSNEKCKVKPFWIDMPRLYEMYVYGKLLEMTKTVKDLREEEIIFQCNGYMQTAADFVFVNNAIILDAKYKPSYDNSNKGLIHDVREISGYCRDVAILNQMKLNYEGPIKSVIIYPPVIWSGSENNSKDSQIMDERSQKEENLESKLKKIEHYKEFYKMPIDIPLKKKNYVKTTMK